MTGIASYYASSLFFMLVLQWIGSLSDALYWRCALLFLVFIFELFMMTGQLALDQWICWRTRYELVALVRQLFVCLTIALNQIGPVLFPVDNRTLSELITETEQAVRGFQQSGLAGLKMLYEPVAAESKLIGIIDLSRQIGKKSRTIHH